MPFAFVLFEGVRSAEPPSSWGMAAARWSSTLPLADRVAISLPPATNSARAAAIALFQSAGNFPSLRRSNSERSSARRRLDAVGPSHAGLSAFGADLTPLPQQRLGNNKRR